MQTKIHQIMWLDRDWVAVTSQRLAKQLSCKTQKNVQNVSLGKHGKSLWSMAMHFETRVHRHTMTWNNDWNFKRFLRLETFYFGFVVDRYLINHILRSMLFWDPSRFYYYHIPLPITFLEWSHMSGELK